MNELRTIYNIIDEHNKISSISLFKLDADVLQDTIENVHKLVQEAYDKIFKYYPIMGRIKRGDLVRFLMMKEAQTKSIYLSRLNKLF